MSLRQLLWALYRANLPSLPPPLTMSHSILVPNVSSYQIPSKWMWLPPCSLSSHSAMVTGDPSKATQSTNLKTHQGRRVTKDTFHAVSVTQCVWWCMRWPSQVWYSGGAVWWCMRRPSQVWYSGGAVWWDVWCIRPGHVWYSGGAVWWDVDLVYEMTRSCVVLGWRRVVGCRSGYEIRCRQEPIIEISCWSKQGIFPNHSVARPCYIWMVDVLLNGQTSSYWYPSCCNSLSCFK